MTRVRKQVLLDPEQELKLRALAERWHSSESEVLRIGLDRLIEEEMSSLSSRSDVDGEEDSQAPSDEDIAELEDEVDRWSQQHPRPLRLSELVIADREGR